MDLSWKKDVERTLRMLEQRTADLPTRLRGGGSGGGTGTTQAFWYEEESYPELPDASTVARTAMARVTAGVQAEQIYKVNEEQGIWESIHETYEGESGATLPENEYIQQHAVARINSEDDEDGDIYVRNAANDGWIRIGPVRVVESLPEIPSAPGNMMEVYWTSVGGGSGDDQVWRAFPGQTEWTPTQYYSALSGAPPEE